MKRGREGALLIGLDVGTHKTVCIVADATAGGIEVVGVGVVPSKGIKRGVVVDIESTTASIQAAVKEAEATAGCDINSVTATIGGSHIRGWNSHGVYAIREREVQEQDVDQALEAARAVAIPAEQKLIHTLPQEYVIDDQDGIRFPIGMAGVRLEVRTHLITAAQSAIQNLSKCVARCGLSIDDYVYSGLASSTSVLTEDEKNLGVLLVDMGAGTCDLAVYAAGAMRHSAAIPVAGDAVTNDIAKFYRTSTQSAEEMKVRYACALARLAHADESILVQSVGDREAKRFTRTSLAQVIEPRYEELYALIKEELRNSGFDQLVPAGVVLTGGAAKMEGAAELAEEVFELPVRLGAPSNIAGLGDVVGNETYAAAVGILLHAHAHQRMGNTRTPSVLRTMWQRVKTWYQGEF